MPVVKKVHTTTENRTTVEKNRSTAGKMAVVEPIMVAPVEPVIKGPDRTLAPTAHGSMTARVVKNRPTAADVAAGAKNPVPRPFEDTHDGNYLYAPKRKTGEDHHAGP